ncbi:maleylpyruvate isomerase N-terminal domain-containing protein [Micromonospora sp. WMMC250]|uniref:maleylpyruvate isomerase N-terminal domain-containing protein n=1 Tax=Micromonospora sp. WMMC250 TaxID=3014781 RepID=UPI0022B69848|nr:maleylpyruvate isomerase N-terminal domain-containing protein [Micromonospora sp. WMMC250]MCZ7375320.1 maleylpyruvate isomerase N-terminal domain-containing protein [Micromonospora sp. WMMC250]
MIRPAFLDAAATGLALLRNPILAERWSSPSALRDFSTGGLARHLANQVTHTVTFLAAPPGESAISVLEHFTGNAWVTSGVDGAGNIDIRRRSEQTAAVTNPRELADTVDTALTDLDATVTAQPSDRIVDLGDWGLKVDDFLLTRVMELVVHTDDLAVSLGLPTPPMPQTATEATIQLLSSLAAWRHGSLNVIRALARQERAPTSISAL